MAVLAGSMLGFIGIALSVSIVLGTLSLAIQGTESPLYETTSAMDGTSASGTTLHSVIEGVIMIFQGEGEGGLVGALNVSAAAFTIATAAAMLFRSTAAFMIAPVLLAIGAFQLIKQATDNFALSLTGAISTLLVTGAIIVTKGAVLTGGIATAATTLSGFIAAVLLGVGLIVGAVTGFVAVLMGYGSTIEAIIITVVSAFALAIGAIVLGVSLPVAAVGAAIVGLVVLIIRFRDQIRNFFVGIVETASDGITKFRGRIEKGIKILKLFIELFVARKRKQLDDAIAYIRAVPGKIRDGLLNGMRNVAKGLVNIINNFIRAVNKLEIPDFIPKIGGKKPNIPLVSIPALAKGGVVSTPTLAMIGESGPEAVVPLNRASQFGKNNVTVNINVSGVTDRSDKRALAREISDIIAQEMRRNGGSPTRGRF